MMGPGYFVIAILGCADGGAACTPVATLPARYETQAQCDAATVAALEAHNNFDFSTLLAQCRSGSAAKAAAVELAPEPVPADARRS